MTRRRRGSRGRGRRRWRGNRKCRGFIDKRGFKERRRKMEKGGNKKKYILWSLFSQFFFGKFHLWSLGTPHNVSATCILRQCIIYFKVVQPYEILVPGWLVLSLSPETVLAPTAAVEDCCLLSSSSRLSLLSRTA